MAVEQQGEVRIVGGLLAGNAPGTSLTTLYTATRKGGKNYVLFIANISASSRTFRVQVTNGTITRYLAYDAPIAANSLPDEIGIPSLKAGDIIKTYGSTTDVEFTLFGDEAA